MASDTVALVVRFRLLAGHEDAFDELMAETLPLIEQNEPGTLAYVTHVDSEDPTVRLFYELYRDASAFEAHEASDHGRRFLGEREAHLAGPPEVWRVSSRGGHTRPLPPDLHA